MGIYLRLCPRDDLLFVATPSFGVVPSSIWQRECPLWTVKLSCLENKFLRAPLGDRFPCPGPSCICQTGEELQRVSLALEDPSCPCITRTANSLQWELCNALFHLWWRCRGIASMVPLGLQVITGDPSSGTSCDQLVGAPNKKASKEDNPFKNDIWNHLEAALICCPPHTWPGSCWMMRRWMGLVSHPDVNVAPQQKS